MRIIAGTAGSIPLQVPKTITRPTTDRVRESLFAALGDLVVDSRVLDLFAGTGSLGLEALSRGAASADFVEAHAPAAAAIEQNLRKTRLTGGRVHRRDVFAFLSTAPAARHGLVFADPPYAREEPQKETLARLLASDTLVRTLEPGGILILETLASEDLPAHELWDLRDERTYGTTSITFLTPAT